MLKLHNFKLFMIFILMLFYIHTIMQIISLIYLLWYIYRYNFRANFSLHSMSSLDGIYRIKIYQKIFKKVWNFLPAVKPKQSNNHVALHFHAKKNKKNLWHKFWRMLPWHQTKILNLHLLLQYAAFRMGHQFLPFFYVKSWSNLTPNVSFKICSS